MNSVRFVSIAAAAAAAFAAATPAAAQFHCYDFSGLAVGTRYNIGHTVNAAHATITLKPYTMGGNQVGEAANFAEAQQAVIAGGSPPEMGLKTLSVQVTPNQPVTRMRVRLAQQITPTGGFGISNFEVNGERHEGPSFASAHGKRLGGAEISASFANNSGNWHVGTLELRAKPGGEIKSFSLGGHTWRMDDMCVGK
jgi:hypothetical protein